MPVHNNVIDTPKHLLKELFSNKERDDDKLNNISKSLSYSSISDASSLSGIVTPVISREEIKSIDSSYKDIDESYSNSNLFNIFDNKLTRPQTTSILKPGSKFVGSQQSGRSTYEVSIEFKHVDLSKSYLDGFLKIKGLTESYPEIITFFDAEIISDKYQFLNSRNPTYNSNKSIFNTTDEIDVQHWTKFPFWRNNDLISSSIPTSQTFKKLITNDDYNHKDFLSKKYIYMRWKEKFLIPDAKVNNIEGASFAGFYYICFNQLTGDIMGLYYHKNSEKFQQLELNYVEDRGMTSSYQFH